MEERRNLAPDVGLCVLQGVLAASSEVCWCMDVGRPVKLAVPDHEVVRQVVENAPFWCYANPAKARLGLLEGEQPLRDRPV